MGIHQIISVVIFSCNKWFEETNHCKIFPLPSLFLSSSSSVLTSWPHSLWATKSSHTPSIFDLLLHEEKASGESFLSFCYVLESPDHILKKRASIIWSIPFFKCSPITLYHLIRFPILISRTYWWIFFLVVDILISFTALPNGHLLVSGNQIQ